MLLPKRPKKKCQFCEDLGAAKAINYEIENFEDAIKQLTNGKGVDVMILDMIGGDYTAPNIRSLAFDGRLVLINMMMGKRCRSLTCHW